MKINCQICGKEYDCCPDCQKRGNWRSIVCSPEHYQIVQILRDYREGVLNDKEATERLGFLGITADTELNMLGAVERDIKAIIAKGNFKRVSKPKNNKVEETENTSEPKADE